ncbi:MAG: hypothetical protein FJ102_20930, partial [Deltaproteobacteria bacterium]|nr:hypothetical protein [Deltaproteobacteria bacterium]
RDPQSGAAWTYDESRLNSAEYASLGRLEAFSDGTLLVVVRVEGDLHTSYECFRLDLATGAASPLPHTAVGALVVGNDLVFPVAEPLPEDEGEFPGFATAVPGELWTWRRDLGLARRYATGDGATLGRVAGLQQDGSAATLRADGRLLVVGPARPVSPRTGEAYAPVSLHDASGQVIGGWRCGRDARIVGEGDTIEWTESRGWLHVARPGLGTGEWRETGHAGAGVALVAGDYVVTACSFDGIAAWRRDTGALAWRVHAPGVQALAAAEGELVAILGGAALVRYDLSGGRVVDRAVAPVRVLPGNLVATRQAALVGASPALYWPRGGAVQVVPGSEGAWSVRAAEGAGHLWVMDFARLCTWIDVATGERGDAEVRASLSHVEVLGPRRSLVATQVGDVAVLEGGRLSRLLPAGAEAYCLAARGDWVAGLFKDGKLRAWNLSSGQALVLPGFAEYAWDLRFVDAARLAGWGRGPGEGWRTYDLEQGTCSEVAPPSPGAGPVGLDDLVALRAVDVHVQVDVGGTTRRESRAPTPPLARAAGLRVEGNTVIVAHPGGELHYQSPEGVRHAHLHPPDRLAVIDKRGRLSILAVDP